MEIAWRITDEGVIKINVHNVARDEQLHVRNLNDVGVIARQGQTIWAALGPLNDMTEQEALTLAEQSRIVQAVGRGFSRVHIETVNSEFHDTMRIQEFIFLPQDLVEAFRLVNTFYIE